MNRISKELEAQICDLYRSNSTITEITELSGASRSTVCAALERNGLYSKKKRNLSKKECPGCHATGHNKGALYCWQCGEDIRPANQLMAQKVSRLKSMAPYLEQRYRADYTQMVNEVYDFLRGLDDDT